MNNARNMFMFALALIFLVAAEWHAKKNKWPGQLRMHRECSRS